ncbi:hypothetical protein ACH4C6_34335 [Streptomyces sp. NPDC017943]|uniref:hypothetical protein n=1 Tax=Streptomyces sp. NPDC017943 TaxID=3365019 RepID=UPI003792DB1F
MRSQGITAQYNKPLKAEYIAEQAVDFERRWQTLVRHHANARSSKPATTHRLRIGLMPAVRLRNEKKTLIRGALRRHCDH